MLLLIAIGSSMSQRLAERIGFRSKESSLLFGLTKPSNMQRSACALTAFAGQPTTSSRFRMLGGMEKPMSRSRCFPSAYRERNELRARLRFHTVTRFDKVSCNTGSSPLISVGGLKIMPRSLKSVTGASSDVMRASLIVVSCLACVSR